MVFMRFITFSRLDVDGHRHGDQAGPGLVLVGACDAEPACTLADDLAARLASRDQITTDGLKCCLQAIELPG